MTRKMKNIVTVQNRLISEVSVGMDCKLRGWIVFHY